MTVWLLLIGLVLLVIASMIMVKGPRSNGGLLSTLVIAALGGMALHGGLYPTQLPQQDNVSCSGDTITLTFSEGGIDEGLLDDYRKLFDEAGCNVNVRGISPRQEISLKPSSP